MREISIVGAEDVEPTVLEEGVLPATVLEAPRLVLVEDISVPVCETALDVCEPDPDDGDKFRR